MTWLMQTAYFLFALGTILLVSALVIFLTLVSPGGWLGKVLNWSFLLGFACFPVGAIMLAFVWAYSL